KAGGDKPRLNRYGFGESGRGQAPPLLKMNTRFRISIPVVVVMLLSLLVSTWIIVPGALAGLFPKVATTGDFLVVAPKTMSFSVDAKALLRATSVREFGAPTEFANYWQFQIISLAAEGKRVAAGEQLIAFDAQKIRDDLQRFQNELDQANKELEKSRAQIDLEVQDLRSRLAAAENNYAKLKLKQSVDTQYDVQIDVEKDRLAFVQAQAEVAALKERIAWHKKSSEATYQIIATKRGRFQNRVDSIKKGMETFQTKADRDGVLIYKTKWNGERFQVGETVWGNQAVLEIPDLNTLMAESFIPEVDIGKIKLGQRAEMTIDAFPGKTYSGSVKRIGTLVRPKSWDIPNKILDAQIALDNLDTSIMRPGMSVKTKIETASIANCLAIPLKSVRATVDGSLVKVKTEQGWVERAVKLGDSNGVEIQVLEGLNAGDRIATDFAKAK
ncbi:MAG: efflux RND transporter periplasmic adaptor subunit, partial [Acidobacteriota bacterium]